jgi:hypothetical protein
MGDKLRQRPENGYTLNLTDPVTIFFRKQEQ